MKYKWQFYTIFILHAARVVLSSVAIPVFYKKIVDVISTGTADRAALAGTLFEIIIMMGLFLALAWFFGRGTQFLTIRFQSSVIKDLYDLAFTKTHQHSYMFFANNFSGSLVSKSRKFVRAFESMHDITIDNFWSSAITFIAVFAVFLYQAPSIAFIFLITSIVYISIVFFMSKKKVEYDIAEASAEAQITGHLADSVTNALAIKSSSALGREIMGFKMVTAREAMYRLRAWTFGVTLNALQSGMTMILQIVVALITANLWLKGEITAGMFVLTQSYSITIAGLFWDLSKAMTKFTRSLSDMADMVKIFREVPDVLDPPNPEQSRIKDGLIEIKNMNFVYYQGVDVFKDFSLTIKPGEKVGLVGHSGSGKSTITKLLMRFLDITGGEILIDGQNIKNITQDDLRKNISYIAQEPILFHRSIKENIAYSYPEATDEEIIEAAKKAHAHEFISGLYQGYDTLVGERGVKLSGGERQRVSIARAMLKPAPILILDEATSSLDSISESYIQDSLNELTKGKTTIVIAHRLSTIQKMDRIVVLEKGKIVEEGTHQELLKIKDGFYADLWNHQTGGFL